MPFTAAVPVAAQSWAIAAGNHADEVIASPMRTMHEMKKPSGDLRRISATPLLDEPPTPKDGVSVEILLQSFTFCKRRYGI